MEITTALTIVVSSVTVAGMLIAALLNYAKSVGKEKDWEKPLNEIKNEIQTHKICVLKEISDVTNKVKVLEGDSAQIAEIKNWIIRLEGSIDQESDKLEKKVDELMRLVISLLQGKKQ